MTDTYTPTRLVELRRAGPLVACESCDADDVRLYTVAFLDGTAEAPVPSIAGASASTFVVCARCAAVAL